MSTKAGSCLYPTKRSADPELDIAQFLKTQFTPIISGCLQLTSNRIHRISDTK